MMAEDYHEYLREWFDRLAPNYDRLEVLLGRVRPVVMELAAPGSGLKVLDAATGTGNQALAFAEKGCEVTGIDLSYKMIEVARSKNTYRNAVFQAGDDVFHFSKGSFKAQILGLIVHLCTSLLSLLQLHRTRRLARECRQGRQARPVRPR